MGIFSDWAPKYFDNGLYTIPCNGKKAPVFEGWSKFCEVPPSEDEFEKWTKKYSDSNQIGLLLGPSTKIVAFDFDYAYSSEKCKISEDEFIKDRQRIEKEIMELLPQTSFGKVGMKGWTRFYSWNKGLVNKVANRNGVRLFDFLSTGRQTIIPPSLHSIIDNKKINYRWIDEDFNSNFKLPELNFETIETITSLYCDRTGGGRPQLKDLSRHERVMYFILDAIRIDNNLDRVAESAVSYDLKINGDKPYLTDSKYYISKDAMENSKSFTQKISLWANRHEALKTKDDKKKKSPLTKVSWDHFFETAFFETRKDIFSRDTFIRKSASESWEPIGKYEGILRSYAADRGLPKSSVVDELERWSFEKENMKFLCDLPKWDGIDRIEKISGSISSKEFSKDQIVEIFKHWGVHIFRRVKDPEIQNRCIILKGNQGKGKDSLVKALVKDFKPYYESTTLPGTQKDVLEIVSRLLVVHIEEFDQTKGLDVAFLKSLITQSSSFFREAYGHSPNQKMMRPSFISTANVDDILRDPTGNRRFIVLPIDNISWEYPQGESMQVMSQWKHLFEMGEYFNLQDSTEVSIKTVIDDYTPENLDVSIMALYRAKFALVTGVSDEKTTTPYPLRLSLGYEQVVDILGQISKTLNCSLRRVQTAVKTAGCIVRINSGNLYYKDRTHAAEHYFHKENREKHMNDKF